MLFDGKSLEGEGATALTRAGKKFQFSTGHPDSACSPRPGLPLRRRLKCGTGSISSILPLQPGRHPSAPCKNSRLRFCPSKIAEIGFFSKAYFCLQPQTDSMETTLHRQLKEQYREPGSRIEVKLGSYRIDVVNGNRLMEIQRSGLASIRDKINKLLKAGYLVDVVKPLVTRKRLIKLNKKNGKEIERRWSPLRGTILDLFDELVYFTRVFPHPNLTLITPLIQIEEIRYPGHGKRRRKRTGDFVVQDRMILEMGKAFTFRTVHDLHKLLPRKLPRIFDTQQLADGLSISRHQAQRIAYVMRKTGAAVETGKQGNAILCRLTTQRESRKVLAKKDPGKLAIVDFEMGPPTSDKPSTRKPGVKKKATAKRKTTIAKPKSRVVKPKSSTATRAKRKTGRRKQVA